MSKGGVDKGASGISAPGRNMTITLDAAAAERLAWLAKNLAMAGIQTSDSEIIGVLIMTAQREALETAFKGPLR